MRQVEQTPVFSEAQALVAVLSVVVALSLYFARGRVWLRRWSERRLRRSEVFSEVKAFMRECEKTDRELAQGIQRVHLSVLQGTLFTPTTSRRVHEQQLKAGKEYLELGGNGPAEAQYEVLYQDYVARSKSKDWRYDHG